MFDRFIAFQARQQPRSSAIVTLRGDISFARFDDEIGAMAHWVRGLKLERGRVTVVRIADQYLHWLVLLALARLGIPSASVAASAMLADIERFAPQHLITDSDLGANGATSLFATTRFSVADARTIIASGERLRAGLDLDATSLARVASSSGTTGAPKLIGFSWRQVNLRFPSFLRAAPQILERLLALVGPEMGGFEASLCTWSVGGTVIFGPRQPAELAQALPQLAPSALAGAPVQLQLLLKALPDGFLPMPSTRVALFGAHTPSELRREISTRLSSDVHTLYGSTEAGLMAWAAAARLTEPTAVGFVPPWVELEVVDEQHRACAPACEGMLRVRGPGVAQEYVNDPAASAAHFREGWFYPGDIGLLSREHLLHLHGRTNEVINLGGDKVLPVVLEEAARSFPGVADAAAFMAPDRGGTAGPWIAVVGAGLIDQAKLYDHLRRAGAAAVNLIVVPLIPRNARGKILREALRDAVLRSQGDAGPGR